jgi:hypothetical protein
MGFGAWATSAEGNHPSIAGALYTLAVVSGVAAIVLMLVAQRADAVTLEEWRRQEDRFRNLNQNILGHYDQEAGSRVLKWSVWPAEGATERDRAVFMDEAIHASRLLKKALGYSEQKYVTWFGPNEVDQWLTAIRSLVHPGTAMHSSGVFEGKRLAGHYVERLPEMSAAACVKLATGVRPRVGVPSSLGG